MAIEFTNDLWEVAEVREMKESPSCDGDVGGGVGIEAIGSSIDQRRGLFLELEAQGDID